MISEGDTIEQALDEDLDNVSALDAFYKSCAAKMSRVIPGAIEGKHTEYVISMTVPCKIAPAGKIEWEVGFMPVTAVMDFESMTLAGPNTILRCRTLPG